MGWLQLRPDEHRNHLVITIHLSIYLYTHYITVSKQIIDFRILLHTLSHLKSHSYH